LSDPRIIGTLPFRHVLCITVLTAVKSSVPTPTLTHVIPAPRDARKSVNVPWNVLSVTSFDDDVFVLRHNSQRVEVYDAVTFTLQRHIGINSRHSQINLHDIIVCATNKCLYLSDIGSFSVHRVELPGRPSNATKMWSVARCPKGLSVNACHNLVVACEETKKLQVYTTHGVIVREISLHLSPSYAVQLSTGDYVVSESKSVGVVGIVTVDGQVVHVYGESQISDHGLISFPSGLAVTKNDDILVADRANNRIMSIDRSLERGQELALSVDGGIQQAHGLCLDESRSRLYVGEFGGQHRVLVFDGVRC